MQQWEKIGDLTLTDATAPRAARQVKYKYRNQEIEIWQDESQCLYVDMTVSEQYRNQLKTLLTHLVVNGLGTLSLAFMLVEKDRALRLEPAKTTPIISNSLIKHALTQIFDAPHLVNHKENLLRMIRFAIDTPVPKYVEPPCPPRKERENHRRLRLGPRDPADH